MTKIILGGIMKGNLERLKKALKAFAKRMKGFKYTNLAVIVFLLAGIMGRAENFDTLSVYIDTSEKSNASIPTLTELGINKVNVIII